MTRWLVCVSIVAVGCGGSDEASLTAAQRAAVDDGLDSIDTSGTIVDQVEITLSGTLDPASPPDEAAVDSVLAAEGRLTPSTCIDSTVQGTVVTHVLDGCTGPRGRVLSGTIVSTWSQEGACLRVEHVATDFTIGARSATGSLGVTICGDATTETRARELEFEATTRNDEPISLTGSWEVSVDLATGCATQSGTVTGQIGDRTLDRSDTDLEYCAEQSKRAPLDLAESVAGIQKGSLVLEPGISGAGEFLRIEFRGGGRFDVFDLDGNYVGDSGDGTGI